MIQLSWPECIYRKNLNWPNCWPGNDTSTKSSRRSITAVRKSSLSCRRDKRNSKRLGKRVFFLVRPKVIKAAESHLKGALKSYMLRPVIRSVEMDEPLEYLTEMRQVVILFINVITIDAYKQELVSLVNIVYKCVCQ